MSPLCRNNLSKSRRLHKGLLIVSQLSKCRHKIVNTARRNRSASKFHRATSESAPSSLNSSRNNMVLLTMTAPIVEALKLKNNLELRTEITQSKTELLGQATSSSTSDLDVLKLSSDAQKAREAGLDVDSTFLGHSGDIKEAGLSAPEEEDGLQPTEPSLLHPAIGMPISHGQIIDLSTTLRSQGHTSYTLEKLLLGSKVFIPPPPPEPEQVWSSQTSRYQH